MKKQNTKDNYKKKKRARGYRSNDDRKDRMAQDNRDDHDRRSDGPKSFDDLASNDINWWNKATTIYPQVTKIPFNRILGDTMLISEGPAKYTSANIPGNVYETIPGVLTVDFTPTVGRAVSSVDAINLAFDRVYSYIYQQYTGAQNFTKADVAFQILHEVSIACCIACAKRGLRSLFSYSQVNHNFPKLLYSACGFDVANFSSDVSKYPELVKRLNQVILSFNSLYTPRICEAFDRWYSLCNNVWCDDEDVASQMFLFRPTGWYEFVEAHDDGSGNLIPSTMEYIGVSAFNDSTPGLTVISSIEIYIAQAESLLASIRNSTYFGVVNGALAKCFSGNQLLNIDPFVDGEIISPVFSRNMNWQLNNLISAPWGCGQYVSTGTTSLNVTEDVTHNILICDPHVDNALMHSLPRRDHWILNSYDGNTGDEFIMEATRLMALPNLSGSAVNVATNYGTDIPLLSGTEIPGLCNIYTYTNTVSSNGTTFGNIDILPFHTFLIVNVDTTGLKLSSGTLTMDQQRILELITALSKFRNAPRVYVDIYGNDVSLDLGSNTHVINDNAHIPHGDLGDVYKFTQIVPSGIFGLHDAARLSIFMGLVEKL